MVFTETDCVPTESWLEELVSEVEEEKIVRGLEVIPSPISMANIAITRKTLGKHRFDRTFYPGEDTELFSRLMMHGIAVKQLQKAIVFHNKRRLIGRSLKWAFLHGISASRIYYRYGTVFRSWYHTIGNDVTRIMEEVLRLIGTMYGLIRYMPERRGRQRSVKK